jgi:hypothetical protein
MEPILDFLRGSFVYIVAVVLPLAGLILAIIRLAEGDRIEGARIAAAAALGGFLYALLLT